MAIRKVGVIGAGLMGHGIAQVAAQGGCEVLVCEAQQGFLDKGLERIDKSLAKLAEKAKEKGQTFDAAAVRARIRGTLSKADLADCDLVVEAIVEDLDVKKALFAELGKIVKKDGIFASNTSSFPIAEMATASGRADRFVGLHFFNPVQLMKLVEVVKTDKTNEDVVAQARAFGEACGKSPITCKDTPGFVVNRLLVPYMAEAMKLAERGDASIPDIDVAMKLGCGYPMGPFELTDYVGLDTTLFILQGWVKRYPNDPAFQIPKLLEAKVKEGKLGRKTGQGFYTWQGDKRV
ncbi:MAG: 3-hydroxyacyl-CoA dehydrogenase NAD-binding domain-containing protein [Planctomycetota bacterium]|nr:3-hydroxyacyl-CoA dehydrogenase NAD-binding domain-containing protein [Planctomycetota bacterium]